MQPNLRIFDAEYIAENIYLGDAIGTDQRRNLCNVILGREGVAIAQEYHDLDTGITEKNNAIRDARRVLTTHIQASQVDTFIGLEADANIDDKIEAKRKEVEGLKDIDKLRSQSCSTQRSGSAAPRPPVARSPPTLGTIRRSHRREHYCPRSERCAAVQAAREYGERDAGDDETGDDPAHPRAARRISC